jgi:hypothetical protein
VIERGSANHQRPVSSFSSIMHCPGAISIYGSPRGKQVPRRDASHCLQRPPPQVVGSPTPRRQATPPGSHTANKNKKARPGTLDLGGQSIRRRRCRPVCARVDSHSIRHGSIRRFFFRALACCWALLLSVVSHHDARGERVGLLRLLRERDRRRACMPVILAARRRQSIEAGTGSIDRLIDSIDSIPAFIRACLLWLLGAPRTTGKTESVASSAAASEHTHHE